MVQLNYVDFSWYIMVKFTNFDFDTVYLCSLFMYHEHAWIFERVQNKIAEVIQKP